MSALDGTGVQFFELPPRRPERAFDYSASGPNFFRDSSIRVTQMGVDVVFTATPNLLVTQMGIEVVVSLSPQGSQLTGNAPSGPRRAVDYSFVAAPSLGLLAVITPPNPGNTSLTSTALPPRAPTRAVDYSWFNPLLPQLAGKDTLLPYHSTATTELPPKAPARSVDYTFVASFPLTLIGQDQLVVGEQLSGNAPPTAPRASTLSDPGTNAIIYLTAPLPPNPRFAGGQSTGTTELPPKAAARSVDYTWLQSLKPYLIGQDRFNPGVQVFDLPPRGALRARDYSWVYTLPAQFPPAAPSLPPGNQLTSIEPRGPARLRGEYPSLARGSVPLLMTPPAATEQFQAVFII